MSGNRKVSPEEKLQAVYEYLEGKGGVGYSPFRQWIQKYQAFGKSAFIKTGHILLSLSRRLLKHIYPAKVLLRI